MIVKPYAAGIAISCLMLCVGCTPAPVVPPPVIVYSAYPKVIYCPMPERFPAADGDLSANISRREHPFAACALQVETIKDCQDKLDEKMHAACEKRWLKPFRNWKRIPK